MSSCHVVDLIIHVDPTALGKNCINILQLEIFKSIRAVTNLRSCILIQQILRNSCLYIVALLFLIDDDGSASTCPLASSSRPSLTLADPRFR